MLSVRHVIETVQWYFGTPGSGAPLHYHGNAVNVLVRGSKLWLVLPPRNAVYSRQHPSSFMGGTLFGETRRPKAAREVKAASMFVRHRD